MSRKFKQFIVITCAIFGATAGYFIGDFILDYSLRNGYMVKVDDLLKNRVGIPFTLFLVFAYVSWIFIKDIKTVK